MRDLEATGNTIYPLIREDMGRLLADVDSSVLDLTCVACPDWSIRGVLAHTIHAFGSFMYDTAPEETMTAITEPDDDRRREAALRRDQWTQAGVDARRDLSAEALLAEWDEIIASGPDRIWMGVLDGTTHLYDIKETLGDSSGTDSPIVAHAFERCFHGVHRAKWELDDVQFAAYCTDRDVRYGPEDAPTVQGSTYELLRAGWGRRSLSQASEALDWAEVPRSQRASWSIYGWTG